MVAPMSLVGRQLVAVFVLVLRPLTSCAAPLISCAALLISWAALWSEEPPKEKDAPEEISYYRQVRPIFQQHCQGCHQPAKDQGGFVMTDYASLLKPGNSNKPGVVVGHPESSLVFQQITSQAGKPPAMPKGQDPLIDHDVNLIRRWIAQGAKDDSPPASKLLVDADHPPAYAQPPVITSLSYSPDGKLLAVSGYHEVLLHKADGSGLAARLIGLAERIQSVAFSPDGKWLAVAAGDPCRFGELQVWNVKNQRLKFSVPVTYDTIYGASWSPDGSKIAFGCADKTLRAVDATNGKQVLYQGAHTDWVLDTVFSTEGLFLVSVSRDMSMKLTEVATQRFIDNVTSITPGALKGGLIAVARRPLQEKKMVKSPPDPRDHLYNELAVGGSDGVPRLYKMHRETKRVIGDDANRIREFEPMPGRIFALVFSADGSLLAASSSYNGQGEVRVYKVDRDKPDPRYIGLTALTTRLSRGLMALSLLGDWRPAGQLVSKFEGQKGAVYALAYRPDGRQVASAGFDGVVRLSDPRTGKLIKEFVPVPLSGAVTAQLGGK
jgi:WD40 repeat protein/mono/diheme cytochrome c family protein